MHIAIDIDGTLTRYPTQLGALMASLIAENQITILTGTLDNTCDSMFAMRRAQLGNLGIGQSLYTKLFICYGRSTDEVAARKAEFCRDNQVHMVFEDTRKYLEAIQKISPATACWLVFP